MALNKSQQRFFVLTQLIFTYPQIILMSTNQMNNQQLQSSGVSMGMHVRGGSQWKQQRRENSLGPLRRAHPASGATWNVQVVRGKMSTQCLWHACRALMVGILLMIIGASMATIGYYSNDLFVGEFRSNSTVRVRNEQRGLHLNNLSYMGPIIMGVGGKQLQTTFMEIYDSPAHFTFTQKPLCSPCIVRFSALIVDKSFPALQALIILQNLSKSVNFPLMLYDSAGFFLLDTWMLFRYLRRFGYLFDKFIFASYQLTCYHFQRCRKVMNLIILAPGMLRL